MLASEIDVHQDPCALIKGAGSGDANFYGRWLIAASKLETIWKSIQREDEFDCLGIFGVPDLGIGAIDILAGIKNDYCIVCVHLGDDLAEWPIMREIVLMIELGLLELKGNYYEMCIPARKANIIAVRAAALKLAETADEDAAGYPASSPQCPAPKPSDIVRWPLTYQQKPT